MMRRSDSLKPHIIGFLFVSYTFNIGLLHYLSLSTSAFSLSLWPASSLIFSPSCHSLQFSSSSLYFLPPISDVLLRRLLWVCLLFSAFWTPLSLSPSFTLSETIAILHKLLVFVQSKISWRTGYAILPPLCESTGCFSVVSAWASCRRATRA